MPNPNARLDITANTSGITEALDRVNAGLSSMAGEAEQTADRTTGALQETEQAADRLGDQAERTSTQLEEIEAGLEEVAREADQAADQVAEAGRQIEITGDAAGNLGDKAGKLSGVLSLIDPALGDLAGSLGDFTDAAEVALGSFGGFSIAAIGIGPILAGVGVALAAVATAYVTYENVTFEANQEQARMEVLLKALEGQAGATAEEVQALADSWAGFLDISDDIRTKIKLINGELQQEQIDLDNAKNAATEAARAQIGADAVRISQLQELIQRNVAIIRSEDASREAKDAAIAQNIQASDALKEANSTLQEHKAALDETLELIELEAEFRAETTKAAEKQAQAEAGATLAAQAQAEALAKLAAQQQAELDLLDAELGRWLALQGALAGMQGVLAPLEAALLSPLEKLEAEQAAAQDRLLEQYQVAAIAAAGSSQAQLDAWAAYRAGQARLDELYEDKKEEQRAKDKEAADKQAAEAEAKRKEELAATLAVEQQKQAAVLGLATDTADLLSAVTELGLEHTIDQNKKAAKVLFAINKASNIASAVVTGAQATLAAYRSGLELGGPLGLIVAPISAGIAAAFAGVQIATIAAQQPAFHQGGFGEAPIGGLAPDEYLTRKTRNEATLNPVGRQVIGDATIRAANQGKPSGQAPILVVQQYKHRVLDIQLQDNLAGNGVLRQVRDSYKRVGHNG